MSVARPSFVCANCARALSNRGIVPRSRFFSASTSSFITADSSDSSASLPRWKQTPAAMRMPFRLRAQPKQPAWSVNTDQEKLDQAYDKFLGNIAGDQRGREVLDDETKWLAVTHKSFDHGRRGLNDRLAFLGKRIVDLHTSLALLASPIPSHLQNFNEEHVFRHAALDGAENITAPSKAFVLNKKRLAMLANSYGIDAVVRWKPKNSAALQSSGIESVMAHTMYSIVGALALKKGGEVSANVVRARILGPLGLR